MKCRKSSVRRTEVTDPNPMTLPVKFQKPPTLAEQIARFMGAHERFQNQQGEDSPDEADDFDVEDEDEPHSPHELVRDPLLNRDITRYEKEVLDRQRDQFDKALQQKIREDKQTAMAAEKAKKALAAERKASKKIGSPDGDEE